MEDFTKYNSEEESMHEQQQNLQQSNNTETNNNPWLQGNRLNVRGEPSPRKNFGINFETQFQFNPLPSSTSSEQKKPFQNFGFALPSSPWKFGQFMDSDNKNLLAKKSQELQLPERFRQVDISKTAVTGNSAFQGLNLENGIQSLVPDQNQKKDLVKQDSDCAIFKLPQDAAISTKNIFEVLQEVMEKDKILSVSQAQVLADRFAQKSEVQQGREQEDSQRDEQNMDVDGGDGEIGAVNRNQRMDQNDANAHPAYPRNNRPRGRGRPNRGGCQRYKERVIREACGNNSALQNFMITNLKVQQLFKGKKPVRNKKCHYCGQFGHLMYTCQVRIQEEQQQQQEAPHQRNVQANEEEEEAQGQVGRILNFWHHPLKNNFLKRKD